ncbi:MAG: rod shape-determining protein MreC [Cryomorphaceae bacterium]
MPNAFRKSSGWYNFAVVLAVSLSLMVVDARSTWLNGPRNVLSVFLSPIQALASIPATIGRFFDNALTAEPDVKIAYENLRNEYFQLKSETLLLRTLQEENQDLRSLLDASERLNEKITLAELVNVSIDPYNHRILVSRGIRNGVYTGQAVIDDRGVIGQVTEVMPLSSSIMLITDPGHAMPVQIQRNGLRTVIYGTGSVSLLRVPFLNQNSDIMVGDVLISSGLGGRFPNGYPVAVVSDVKVIEDEAFIRVSASPIAKLDRSNHVLLLSREAKLRPELVPTQSADQPLGSEQ